MAERTAAALNPSIFTVALCFCFLQPPPGGQKLPPMTTPSDYCSPVGGTTSPSSSMAYRSSTGESSTSCASHLSSGSGSGSSEGDREADAGYDYEFLLPVDEKYECPICCFVLRNPNQTKCGHRFCAICIRKWINERARPSQKARCPICSEPLTVDDLFSDNFAKREILSLRIHCTHKDHGCEAVMELRHVSNHLSKCDFAMLPCPNGCIQFLMRKDVEEHLARSCERRLVDCQVCHQQITYDNAERHLKTECPMVEVTCELCAARIPRIQLKTHSDEVCPKVLVECAFSKVGCSTKIERDQLDTHLHLSTQSHLKMLAETVESLKGLLHRSSKVDSLTVGQLGGFGPHEDLYSPPIGPLTLPSFMPRSSPYHQSLTATDSGMVSGVSKFTTSPSRAIHSQPTSHTGYYKETVLNVGSSLAPPHLDSLSLNMPTGYSDPFPDTGHSFQRRELEMHSAPDRPMHRPLMRQTSLGEKLGQRSSSDNLSPLYERLKEQDVTLSQQQQRISGLQTHNDSLKQTVEEQRLTIKNLEEKFQEFTLRNCSGTFVWKVENYHQKKMEAQRGARTVIHSDGFYSSMYGYKLCVRLNVNGVESATGTHISLFVHFMQGEYDDILEWPFSGRISLAILDQTEVTQYRQHITETLLSKPNLAAFQRPHTHRNHKGFGYVEFSPLGLIEGKNPCYLKNDTIYIKVKVETN